MATNIETYIDNSTIGGVNYVGQWVDLELVFEPLGNFQKVADVGIQNSAGTDLSAIFAPLSEGVAINEVTDILSSAGTDLRDLFAAKGTVSIVSLNANYYSFDGQAGFKLAESGFRFNRGGTIDTYSRNLYSSTNYRHAGNWITPTASDIGDDYEVRFSEISGTFGYLTGTYNTWLPLTTWRNVSVAVANGQADATVKAEIRKVGTTTILATTNLQMQAESEP